MTISLLKMLDIQSYLTKDRIQECWNDMKYYRDEARACSGATRLALP